MTTPPEPATPSYPVISFSHLGPLNRELLLKPTLLEITAGSCVMHDKFGGLLSPTRQPPRGLFI